ncbi:Major histocompatibility complex class I-related gene protein [Channa argus]|uniref:Major histocompatibility complex class I-related gene protein n=1 Tax=Channa argus TaxID=215402 RepID=A0A6G1QX25_CHAAH|nr:Major histocompatibility complex class I-related gene protein [Channa argus]
MYVQPMELVFLLLFLPDTHSVKNTLTYFFTTSSGLQTIPEFTTIAVVDGVQVGYCDSNNRTAQPKVDWITKFTDDDPQHLEWNTQGCRDVCDESKALIEDLNQHFNQSGGVHILQEFYGCEVDDKTEELHGFDRYSYDGEDFTTFDLRTLTWAYTEKAATFQTKWERLYSEVEVNNNFLKTICPQWLKSYMDYGRSYLQRKVPPSVSLLQKSPSSSVSCHATGFYPDRATMFWRKDEEELHEDVDHGEILPNHDGTFQMRVDLKLSLLLHEDWSRYECVFQLSGLEDDIITKLDKGAVRSNGERHINTTLLIVMMFFLVLILIAAAGFMFYKKKTAPVGSFELFERLNSET